MSPYQYTTPPSVLFGRGLIQKAGQLINEHFAVKRVLVITDPGIKKAGLLKPLIYGLGLAGLEATIFEDISSDPLEADVVKGAAKAKAVDAGCIIGLGGGSPMDAAKAIAILAGTGKAIEELYGQDKVSGCRMPLVLIPTTAGTGSEVTPYAVITHPNGDKTSITDQQSVPDAAILDAELTLGLPQWLTAACGIDAMVHAIEAFTSKGNKTAESDITAKKALKLLWDALPEALADGDNIKARENMLVGAMLAGKAIANAPVGGIHALAYPLGGLHHIHHGHSNALLLPPVMRFNAAAAAPLYAELTEVVMPDISGGDEAKALALIDTLETMILDSGLETRLAGVGLKDNDIPDLATEAMKLERLLKNNPTEISITQCQEIYESIY